MKKLNVLIFMRSLFKPLKKTLVVETSSLLNENVPLINLESSEEFHEIKGGEFSVKNGKFPVSKPHYFFKS